MLRIANAIGEVKRLTTADRVSSVGASIVARPALSIEEIHTVEQSAEIDGRELVHRPDMSDDTKTWFDLQRP